MDLIWCVLWTVLKWGHRLREGNRAEEARKEETREVKAAAGLEAGAGGRDRGKDEW